MDKTAAQKGIAPLQNEATQTPSFSPTLTRLDSSLALAGVALNIAISLALFWSRRSSP